MDPSAMESARRRRGLSYRAVERKLVEMLGERFAPSDETIRKYHRRGGVPQRPDPAVLLALCRIYKVDPEEVAPELAEELGRVGGLFGRKRRRVIQVRSRSTTAA